MYLHRLMCWSTAIKRNRILAAIISAFGFGGCQPPGNNPNNTQFVFVRIPEQIQPLDRGDKYEDPLDTALMKAGVGEITGGGSSLFHPDEDGKRTIEWVGIDVDLTDFDGGMAVLKRELLRLGAPKGTVLEYSRSGQKHEELLH